MYLQLALPDNPLEFLMSDSNHEDTFGSLEQLRDNLVEEILEHIQSMPEKPTHIRCVFGLTFFVPLLFLLLCMMEVKRVFISLCICGSE